MPIKVKYDSDEAKRIARIADCVADKLIAGESLRLALPIARLTFEKVVASYKRIEKKYGSVT